MMWSMIVLNMIVSLAIAQKATFENYKVFSIMPTTESQIQQLYKIIQFHDGVNRFSVHTFSAHKYILFFKRN